MAQDIIIALDQGSSSSRALAVAAGAGMVLAKESAPVTFALHGDMCEYDANDLLATQLQVLDKVLAAVAAQNLGRVTQIALSAQRSTIVLWDKNTGKPLCPALSWLDGRASAQTAANIMSQADIHARTGLYKTPYYSAPKIQWCLQNYPAVAAAAKEGALLCGPVATWLLWHMTGGLFLADTTNAQRTLLFNINTMDWDDEILDSFGVTRAILPATKPSAADYGSYKGIPITVCVGDQQAAGALVLARKGDAAITYGTGAFALLNAGSAPVRLPGILTSLAFSAAGPTGAAGFKNDYLLEGPVLAAGSLFTWLESLGFGFNARDLDALAAAAKNPVEFYPALGGVGAPHWDFGAKPVIAGLTPATTKADIAVGAMRGLCFFVSDIFDYMAAAGFSAGHVQVGGGLTASRALLQFQADILQKNLTLPQEADTTALGAAYIAALTSGVDLSAWRAQDPGQTIIPNIPPAESEKLKQTWRKLADWARKVPSPSRGEG